MFDLSSPYSIALLILLKLSLFFILKKVVAKYFPKPLYWIWDNAYDGIQRKREYINCDNINFPKGFLWGVATASYQVEGNCDNNQWYKWEHAVDENGKSRIKTGELCGLACDHWNRYKEDIDLIKNELHCNSYRFSLEWSKIQPSKDTWDIEAINHYRDVLVYLKSNNIVPMITLHHFTNPIWFEDLGGWEKNENIKYFVEFSKRVFQEYAPYCKFWCTINEVYVFSGYFAGVFPPGKKDAKIAGTVLFHLLEAHVIVYNTLKSMDYGKESQIGIVKDIFQFDPLNNWNPIDHFLASGVDQTMNECIIEFFNTGLCHWKLFPLVDMTYVNKLAPISNDFIGLNYYSHYHITWNPSLSQPFLLEHRENSIATDMSYPMYPEGIYRALVRLSKLKLPIYVTENGIADHSDDRRALFIRRYLYAISKAIEDGVDVRGYYYWTMMDNFEWVEGYSMRFGLYELDLKTRERKLRDGSKHFIKVAKRFSSPLDH